MRTVIFSTLTAIALITAPALAQNSGQDGKAAPSAASQTEAAKPSQNSNGSQSKTAAEPQTQPAPDHSMTDYNVLGSTAQSAFGHDGP